MGPVDYATAVARQSASFWERQWLWWHRIEAPLRPSRPDIELMERRLGECAARAGLTAPKALLLGVTPELAAMRWPAGTRLLAVDRSQGMIDNVWPKHAVSGAEVVCGEWTELPVGGSTLDFVVGDGCFSQLTYPEAYCALCAEVRRVLRSGGVFALRAFVRPELPQPIAALIVELEAGRFENFHAFKWRFNMAVQRDTAAGVRLGDIWDAFQTAFPDREALSARRGWKLEAIETIDAYRGSDARYSYPTLRELRSVLAAGFSEEGCLHPTYELGECCPTLLLRAH